LKKEEKHLFLAYRWKRTKRKKDCPDKQKGKKGNTAELRTRGNSYEGLPPVQQKKSPMRAAPPGKKKPLREPRAGKRDPEKNK